MAESGDGTYESLRVEMYMRMYIIKYVDVTIERIDMLVRYLARLSYQLTCDLV